MEVKIKGKSVVFGYAKGKSFLYKQEETFPIPCYDISEDQLDHEWQRFLEAVEKTKKQLSEIKETILKTFGTVGSEIFDIQLALLEDPHLLKQLRSKLSEGKKNIEFCFSSMIKAYLKHSESYDLFPLRDRYTDLVDLETRLLKNLLNNFSENPLSKDLQGRILLAKKLTPSDSLALSNKGLVGIILEDKCYISHSLILAKNLGIPIIIGVDNLFDFVQNDSLIEMDGTTGEIWVNTETSHTLPRPDFKKTNFNNPHNIELYLSYKDSIGEDYLNHSAIAGIGLLRSEVLFLGKNNIPDEETQFAYYKEAVTKAKGKSVVLRTLDIGGDKTISANQGNSSPLGLRGIRWSLKNIPAFKAQLRAMLRASAFGNAKILYPMVCSEQEVIQANEVLEACKQELKVANIPFQQNIEVGVMLEIPCTFLIMDLLAKHCSFFSIGTNDLMQYLLAIDRSDSDVAELYDWQHPAILRTLQATITQAKALNVPVYMCGELPNIPEALQYCIGLGFQKFTISEDRLSYYQKLIEEMDSLKLQKDAKALLNNFDK